MPDYSVGFFLVPADFLDELHTMEVECENLPVATSVHEAYFHSNQMFLRARDVAVVSDVVGGSYQPIADHGRSAAFLRLGYWIKNVLLNGYSRGVLDPHHLEPLVHAFDAASLEEFLAWNDRNDLFGAADHALLTELFTALDRVLHARPAEPHGLVYLNFLEKYRDPPPPEPEPPEPTISPADNRKWAQLQQFRIQAAINRQRRPWWVEAQHEEGRVLVGLLVPDRVDELADAYRRAIELFTGDEVRAGQAALNHEVIPRVEAALIEPVIETVGGPVQALRWLRGYLRWKTKKTPAAIYSPDQADQLDQLLNRLLDEESATPAASFARCSDARSRPATASRGCSTSTGRDRAWGSLSWQMAAGGSPPPALTEPDSWVSHPAPRDAGVRVPPHIPASAVSQPQLSQLQLQLIRGDGDASELSTPPSSSSHVIQDLYTCRCGGYV